MNQKRTHQIGVRVNEDELRRLELRAKLTPGYVPVATYLRLRGLDVEIQPDPDAELVGSLERIADLLTDCRRAIRGKQREAILKPLRKVGWEKLSALDLVFIQTRYQLADAAKG